MVSQTDPIVFLFEGTRPGRRFSTIFGWFNATQHGRVFNCARFPSRAKRWGSAKLCDQHAWDMT